MDVESPSGWAGTWEDQCAYIICVYTIVIMCLFSLKFSFLLSQIAIHSHMGECEERTHTMHQGEATVHGQGTASSQA